MRRFLNALRGKVEEPDDTDDLENDYVELDSIKPQESGDHRIVIRPFNIEDFADVKPILDALRDGYTICLVNIKPLKDKDLIELKRAIGKLKKTCDAIKGDIAGFGDDYIVVTPGFAEIYRTKQTKPAEQFED